MFNNELYITITGLKHYYGIKPFKVGYPVTLLKEPDNPYDEEAIMVSAPVLGKVGYVANSPYTVTTGCMSAGRIYDAIPDECVAIARFITSSSVIALVLPDKKLKVKVEITFENQQANSPFNSLSHTSGSFIPIDWRGGEE
ncbi:MAG: HIRAN domain-containing protein [Christensenellales bacterium]|jgi:hypothetical protein